MSTVAESRKALETVLGAGSLRVVPQGVASPPSVFVAPGTSWLTPSQLAFGSFQVNWVVIGVVSTAGDVAVDDIDALAYRTITACKALPNGWGLPTLTAPGLLTLGGVLYLAFRLEIQGVL